MASTAADRARSAGAEKVKQRDPYTVGITLTLRGLQSTSVKAHDLGTDTARIGVRIGTVLIYLLDHTSAHAIADTCRRAPGPLLPFRVPRNAAAADDKDKPAVTVNIAGRPRLSTHLRRHSGQSRSVALQVGEILFDLHDQSAHRSVLDAFVLAEHLADTAFNLPVAPTVAAHAARAAAVALPPPRLGPARTGDRGPGPATTRPTSTARPATARPGPLPRPGTDLHRG
jgi:hypothetical protein